MNSPIAYIGGKSKLSKKIIELMPDHKTYCEAFAGAGWVFFRKRPSKIEIINDLDSDLIAFYRVLQNHLEEFLKQFKWLLSSRQWFDDWKDQLKSRGLTDIQKAARYYYVQRQSFAGRVLNPTFGLQAESMPRINILRMEEELSQVHLRLSGVIIENLTWKDFIKRYDKRRTFFYLDPPYFSEPCYKHNFEGIENYTEMAEILKTIEGKFILSLNDHPAIREVFQNFIIKPVTLQYSVSRDIITDGCELLISNAEFKGNQREMFI